MPLLLGLGGSLTRPPDRNVTEAKVRDPVGLIDIAQIEENGLAQRGFQSVEIEGSKLVPFGHEDQRVCSLCRLIGVFAGDEVRNYLTGFLKRGGIVSANRGTLFHEFLRDGQGRRIP